MPARFSVVCCALSSTLLRATLALLSATPAQAADAVYVPIPLAANIATIETTRIDIGEPEEVFDNDARTLIRTPAINPAFVRVAFKQPVTCDHMRLLLIPERHTWSISVADNLEDLRTRSGSYRVLIKDRTTRRGRIEIPLDQPVTIHAMQLDIERQSGDDYVHISEWQLCRPGKIDQLRIRQITDRRNAESAEGRKEVTGSITRPVQTVVWFSATGVAEGVELDVADEVEWSCTGTGIAPFGEKKGMFLLTGEGEQQVVAEYGDFTQTLTLIGTPRELKNREDDVEIWYIERLPRLAYDDPNGGLPHIGQEITWRGHLYNWSKRPVRVQYEWKLDGTVLATGEQDLPVGPPSTDAVPVDLPWRWQPARHELTLTITPIGGYADLVPANNTLTIDTDAITVGLWVEQSLWEHHHEHQYELPTQDANSFAGWAQRMIRQWNKLFREAVYPEFPFGIQERVRLDHLVIVPDFALPLNGGLPSNNPDTRDKTVDMTWGCESGDIVPGFDMPPTHWWSPEWALRNFARGDIQAGRKDAPFWCGLGYIHEMSHARYLIDGYGFNVHTGHGDDISQRNIRVTDEQGPILGRYMPLDADIVHWRKYAGQMGGDYWSDSVYEAMCWDRVRGQRAKGGNCNAPPNIGEFLQDIPQRVIYEYVDADGNPLANAEVWAYQATGTGKDWYTKVYDDVPDVKAMADAEGRVTFDRTLWSPDGRIEHTYGHSNAVVLIRVTYQGQHYYLFEEVADANIAYNLGFHDEYTFERTLKLRTGEPSPNEWDINARWERPGVGFGRR